MKNKIKQIIDKMKNTENFHPDSIYHYEYYESPKKFNEIVNNIITNYRVYSETLEFYEQQEKLR